MPKSKSRVANWGRHVKNQLKTIAKRLRCQSIVFAGIWASAIHLPEMNCQTHISAAGIIFWLHALNSAAKMVSIIEEIKDKSGEMEKFSKLVVPGNDVCAGLQGRIIPEITNNANK